MYSPCPADGLQATPTSPSPCWSHNSGGCTPAWDLPPGASSSVLGGTLPLSLHGPGASLWALPMGVHRHFKPALQPEHLSWSPGPASPSHSHPHALRLTPQHHSTLSLLSRPSLTPLPQLPGGRDAKATSSLASLPPRSPHPLHPPQSVLWGPPDPSGSLSGHRFFMLIQKPDTKKVSKNVKQCHTTTKLILENTVVFHKNVLLF